MRIFISEGSTLTGGKGGKGKIDSPPHPLLGQPVCLPGPAGFPQPSAFSVQEPDGRGTCPTGTGVEGTYLELNGEHSMFS